MNTFIYLSNLETKMSLSSSSKDAKLGKKCTLLDLSRRHSVVTPETGDAAASSSVAEDPDSACLSKSLAANVESERTEEEKKEELDEKENKKENLLADASPAKMETDPPESPSKEQSMTLFSDACII